MRMAKFPSAACNYYHLIMGNSNTPQGQSKKDSNYSNSNTSIGFTAERIYGVPRHVLVDTKIKPRWNTDRTVVYRWLRGFKIDNVIEAAKDLTREEWPTANFNNWLVVQEGSEYTASEEDLMHVMKVEAWAVDVIETEPRFVEHFWVLPKMPDPPKRQMLPITSDNSTSATNKDFTFSLMSYNILAECYCDNTRYYYCPAYAVLWEYRQNRIYNEIESLKPDIFCLQEFEEYQFLPFESHFKKLGYQGEYTKRTSLKSDGCGIFFNTNKFKLVKKFKVEMDKLVSDSPQLQSFPDLVFKTKRNNVAIILMLKALTGTDQDKYVWVSNCHLYWDPEVPEIKLMQAWYLLNQLHDYQQQMCKELKLTAEQYTTLACGDFNSMPDSMVYEIHTAQRIKETIVPQIVKYSSIVEFTSPIGFESSYKSLGEPVSNYTPGFKGCLDYIWYQPATCTLLEVLENPTSSTNAELKQSIDTYRALPNPIYPSDHLPLMARYALK